MGVNLAALCEQSCIVWVVSGTLGSAAMSIYAACKKKKGLSAMPDPQTTLDLCGRARSNIGFDGLAASLFSFLAALLLNSK